MLPETCDVRTDGNQDLPCAGLTAALDQVDANVLTLCPSPLPHFGSRELPGVFSALPRGACVARPTPRVSARGFERQSRSPVGGSLLLSRRSRNRPFSATTWSEAAIGLYLGHSLMSNYSLCFRPVSVMDAPCSNHSVILKV